MSGAPKVDLAYALQFLGQLYGSVTAIYEARNAVAEQEARAEKLVAENDARERTLANGKGTLAEIESKIAQARDDLARLTKEAEEVRLTKADEEGKLVAIRQQLAEFRTQFSK